MNGQINEEIADTNEATALYRGAHVRQEIRAQIGEPPGKGTERTVIQHVSRMQQDGRDPGETLAPGCGDRRGEPCGQPPAKRLRPLGEVVRLLGPADQAVVVTQPLGRVQQEVNAAGEAVRAACRWFHGLPLCQLHRIITTCRSLLAGRPAENVLGATSHHSQVPRIAGDIAEHQVTDADTGGTRSQIGIFWLPFGTRNARSRVVSGSVDSA